MKGKVKFAVTKVVNKRTELCLDARGGKGNVRDRIVQWNENEDSYAQWRKIDGFAASAADAPMRHAGG